MLNNMTQEGQKKNWLHRLHDWRKEHMSDKMFIIILALIVGFLSAVAAFVLHGIINLIVALLTGRFASDSVNWLYLVYPVIGIYSCGYNWRAMPKAEMDNFLARGKELYVQGCKGSLGRTGDGDELARKYMESKDLAGTPIVGRTYDEIDIGSIGDKVQWIKAMRGSALSSVPMATWSSGYTFTYNALNAEYLSACCNQAMGRGRFQFECYP